MPQQFHRNEGFLDRCKSTSMSCARSTKSSASCKLSRKRNSKENDAPNSPLVKHTIIAGRNRHPGRDTSAGHMKLAYVLVFVGMISDLRIVAEIRS